MKHHALFFALALSFLTTVVAAQEPAPATLTDAERARRDADKVFNFIRFQTVRKPAADGEAKPPRPPRPVARPAPAPSSSAPAVGSATAPAGGPKLDSAAAPVNPAAAETRAPALAATSNPPTAAAASPTPVAAVPVTPAAPPSTTAQATAAAPAPDDDDEDEVPLKLVSFTAPQLSTELQATMGPSQRNIKVRFTVAADGRVTEAQAQIGTPKRLANVATAAIRQWRFEPLPQARDVDVEVAFKRD